MEYQDFVLQLDRAPEGQGFIARVLRSPAGEAEAPFVNPVSSQELDDLWRVAFAARHASRAAQARHMTLIDRAAEPLDAELSLEELGTRLFQALFQGPVRSCWAASVAEAVRDSRRGLRLKLQWNLKDPLLAPFAELPWEYLFSPEQGGFLGLHRQTPILRHLCLPLPIERAPMAQSLRLLIVSSQPCTLSQLSLQEEGERIAQVLGALPGVETLPLHNPSIEALRDVLLEKDFHVLHFMGHGDFDAASGQGMLYFTDEDEAELPVGGKLLASHLAGLPSLRLVFVNACDTARANSRAPFAGVATALLQAGLPAVIAMQRPIGDEAALEFSRSVYRRIAAGDPVDAAVSEGRLAITRSQRCPLEWGTPVLFLRSEDGRLFTPATTPAQPPPTDRPRRRLTALLLGGALAISLSLGVARMDFGPEPEQITNFVLPRPKPEQEPEKKPAPEAPKPEQVEYIAKVTAPPHVPEESQEPPRSAPPRSSASVVKDGIPAIFPDLGAEVGAHFFEREGRFLARFWLAPTGGATLQQPPVLGPGSIQFLSQSGIYHLEVLSLNREERSAEVRLRLVQ